MSEKMKQALQAALQPGESVVWEGKTQPFRIFDGKEGRGVLLRWRIALSMAVWRAAAYATHNGKGTVFYAVLALILIIVIGTSVLSYRQTVGQYCLLTNRRALIIRPNGNVFAMLRSDIGTAQLYPLDYGGAAIALGSALLPERDKQLRWRANHPLESSDYTLHGMVFYHVENADAAMRLLDAAKGV